MRKQTFYNEIMSLACQFAYVKGNFTNEQKKDISEGFDKIIRALEKSMEP